MTCSPWSRRRSSRSSPAHLSSCSCVTARTLRELRTTVALLREDAIALLDDAYAAVRDATYEVERVDRLVTSAEKLNGAVDGAQRIAYKTLASPVVKAMALGSGVSRAAQALRDPVPPPQGRGPSACSPQEEDGVGVQTGTLDGDRVHCGRGVVMGGRSPGAPGCPALHATRRGRPLVGEREKRSGGRAIGHAGA